MSDWIEVFGTGDARVLMRGCGAPAPAARELARKLIEWADALEGKATPEGA